MISKPWLARRRRERGENQNRLETLRVLRASARATFVLIHHQRDLNAGAVYAFDQNSFYVGGL
jgi:hypothetical protein